MAAKFGPNEVILPTATSDTGTTEGAIYYNTSTTSLRIRQSGGWKDVYTPPITIEFKIWGAGGGSGGQNRSSSTYRTSTYYAVKQGGAGGFVYAKFEVDKTSISSIIASVGQGGRGALLYGNTAPAATNGGGTGGYSSNDNSGGGGGYSGIFLNSTHTQSEAIAISPGGGGGGGGPGYATSTTDQSNGGGGIYSLDGTGNAGARNHQFFEELAGGGTPTSGGAGGLATSGADSYGGNNDGASGSALQGANGKYLSNPWGSGGGGGGGWFGGGAGMHDGNSWSGGGGGAGSAFVRGNGVTYSAAGNSTIAGLTYITHTYATEAYGSDNSTYKAMRVPAPSATSDAQYPGNGVAYGGDFETTGGNSPYGQDGGDGAISYSINGGSWITLTSVGNHVIVL